MGTEEKQYDQEKKFKAYRDFVSNIEVFLGIWNVASSDILTDPWSNNLLNAQERHVKQVKHIDE